ncbi:FAD-dependent oxidoreductase [Microbacterium oleivorans]|uniref:FAD-dependent monooxygenase n=1 Tax=Microbacterium oleivorans TaxID=273677 RepID=A0A7D5EVU5_9MICO|nr:NAD(P)/FAD-dependent oxidoreductase [Microbacterium oleivorans]QLD11591.1 FAD-dependent monooxygenase [Microbacterium oleivorans]
MPEVIVVGAGPVGMLLAAELARRDVDVEVVERRAQGGGGSRAIGLHAPVLAALEEGGATDRILARAVRVSRGEARSDGRLLGVVRFDRLSVRHPYVATLPQALTESALAVGAPEPQRGTTVSRVRVGMDAVRLDASDPRGERELSAPIVVVAAGVGARDLVFRPDALGRTSYPDRYLMSDTDVAPREDAETAVVHLAAGGVLESFPLPGGRRRFVAWDAGDPRTTAAGGAGGATGIDEPAARLERLRAALRERGEAAAADTVTAATGFRVRRVLAPAMRRGRLAVIGDSAHEISPIGGQGMNLGLLDAATLAPLLAAWVRTGREPAAALARWERDRLRSARIAGRMAAVNMRLGRPVSAATHALRTRTLGAALAATGSLVPRAYAMGLDTAAR